MAVEEDVVDEEAEEVVVDITIKIEIKVKTCPPKR